MAPAVPENGPGEHLRLDRPAGATTEKHAARRVYLVVYLAGGDRSGSGRGSARRLRPCTPHIPWRSSPCARQTVLMYDSNTSRILAPLIGRPHPGQQWLAMRPEGLLSVSSG